MNRLLVGLIALAMSSAGCLAVDASDAERLSAELGIVAPETPLWLDPQNAPHPAFNFPTLTNVPDRADLPEFWRPIDVRPLPETITGLEFVSGTQADVKRGGGIALFGSLAIVPGYGEPSKTVDISDPTAPKVLGVMEGPANHRGAIVIPYPDGRLVTAFSMGPGIDIWDITDPTDPVHLHTIDVGSHKIGVVPGTPIVYNAKSSGGGNTGAIPGMGTTTTEIFDLTNPAEPVLVQDFANGYGCHHIYFWLSAEQEKYRAICAGIEVTQLWDIADPLNPEVIVNVPVHHGNPMLPAVSPPLVMFSHFASLNQDGTVLIVGDEMGGGGLPPGCDVGVDTGVRHVSGPLGNLWFYDISDEQNPVVKGWFSPSTVLPETTSCTAHHGRIVPDETGRDMLAMAFYGRGVVLIDFTDASNPYPVDSYADGSNTWEVWYYNGYLFTGDLNRGLDVLTFK